MTWGRVRNAFLMLYTHAQERAVNYLMQNLEAVANVGGHLANRRARPDSQGVPLGPDAKGQVHQGYLMLLGTNNASVVYECANTLVALSNAPTAIKAAANCYCQLLVNQSDNNVKLIVLDRLTDLKKDNTELLASDGHGYLAR